MRRGIWKVAAVLARRISTVRRPRHVGGACRGRDDGGLPAPAPGAGVRRSHRPSGLVLEDGPDPHAAVSLLSAVMLPSSSAPPCAHRGRVLCGRVPARNSRAVSAAARPSPPTGSPSDAGGSPSVPAPGPACVVEAVCGLCLAEFFLGHGELAVWDGRGVRRSRRAPMPPSRQAHASAQPTAPSSGDSSRSPSHPTAITDIKRSGRYVQPRRETCVLPNKYPSSVSSSGTDPRRFSDNCNRRLCARCADG